MANEPISFATLDALLDEALALDGAARQAFLERLGPEERLRVEELLELSDALTLGSVAAGATDKLNQIAEATAVHDAAAGRWRLQKELGSGGMGQVFYATREEPGSQSGYIQHAAVKVLWSHRANPDVMARFFRERRILAALDHPGLARFLDGGFLADNRPWFAMEYVDGLNVVAYATQRPIVARLELFLDICASVAYAHERLIVHRDIKPQNVLVDAGGRSRLLDFGVASIVDDVDDGVHTATQGSPLTLQYASPEQVTGGIVTVASDIYQLGLLLYEMLTGHRPHDLQDQSLQQAITLIAETTAPPPSARDPDIRPDLDAIVAVTLNKAPSARYRSATALADDVRRYLDGHPVKAVPHSRWYVARRFVRRNALIVGVVGASVAALAFATVISLRLAGEAQDQARRSAASQQILTDVFQKADPFGASGANVTLADALIRAQPEIAAQVADDPLLAWEVNKTLAEIFESLGLVEHEADAYRAVLRAADQVSSQRDYRRLVGIAGLGGTLTRTNPSDAIAYFEAHLPEAPGHQRQVSAWLNAQYSYVGALARMRAFDRADRGTEQMAQVIARFKIETPRIRGRLSQLLAGVARRGGDRAAEDQHWRDAVAYMRHADNPSALAVTLNNQAIHLGRTGRFEESDAAFRDAIDVFESAAHEDPSFAGVLRSYAGLQFRMGRKQAAIATTERALALLDPANEAYARFVAELNLANYTFATGDTGATAAIVGRALTAARSAFDQNSGVPDRMRGLLAKLLLFGGRRDLAARVLNVDHTNCATNEPLYAALDGLEDPAERPQRDQLWRLVDQLGKTPTGTSRTDVGAVLAVYPSELPAFFDVLDHWRVLEALNQAAGPTSLPAQLTRERTRLADLRAQTRTFVARQLGLALDDHVAYFSAEYPNLSTCR